MTRGDAAGKVTDQIHTIENERDEEVGPMLRTIGTGMVGSAGRRLTSKTEIGGEGGTTGSSGADSDWGMHAQLGAEQQT